MLNRVYFYGTGSNHNFETSVYGGKLIRIPLMEALLDLGVDIRWLGFDCDEFTHSNYLDIINLDKNDYKLDVTNKVPNVANRFMNYMETDIANDAGKELDRNPGILLVELRPNLNKPGYNFQNEWRIQMQLIDLFYEKGLPVLVWDQDIWADHIPLEVRDKIVLLKPYFKDADASFTNQEEFMYMWYKPWFDNKLEKLSKNKIFDVTYCGNVYNRRDEFLQFLKPFDSQNKKVCVQGNWLRKKYGDRDFALDNFKNFMFFGTTPHWSTLPTISMAKSVVHFANPDQQKAGLITARFFEALMGKSVIFCSDKIYGAERIVPSELLVESGEDLIDKWNFIDKNNMWNEMRRLFVDKLGTEFHSSAYKAKQLIEIVKKYYN